MKLSKPETLILCVYIYIYNSCYIHSFSELGIRDNRGPQQCLLLCLCCRSWEWFLCTVFLTCKSVPKAHDWSSELDNKTFMLNSVGSTTAVLGLLFLPFWGKVEQRILFKNKQWSPQSWKHKKNNVSQNRNSNRAQTRQQWAPSWAPKCH